MDSIDESNGLANLPARDLVQALRTFLAPVLGQLPEQRLREVALLAVRGVLAAQSPVLTAMARSRGRSTSVRWSKTS